MNRTNPLVALVALVTLASCQGRGPAESDTAPRLFENLGDHHRDVSTRVDLAQRYFDQGLILTYGFNHAGAVDAFREAQRLDPSCAMCAWGEALALGPNINAPMGPDAGAAAYAAVQRALELRLGATQTERELIDALSTRYAREPGADRRALDRAYAAAMREVLSRHPGDDDVATLYAEALMDLTPWDYYTAEGEPRPHTRDLVATLEAVLERDPDHPGANHYLIHALEEFDPERAEAAADRLVDVAPDAGHLVHMPSHIYWRLGRYRDAATVNELAAAADVAYFAWCRAPRDYAAGYYNHNVHFLWAAAAAEGRSDAALTAARRLVANIPLDEVSTYPFLKDFLVVPVLTLARFGRWDAVLGEPKPPEELRYWTAVWHYARGLAYTRRGALAEAQAEHEALRAIAATPAMEALVLDVAGGTAAERLRIGVHHLAGEMAAARGDTETAVAQLREAVRVQDGANYIEPPAWYLPSRQALGAVLLDAGRAAEAEGVYREDLAQYPKNGWSLYGLAAALRAEGKGAEADWARKGFENAWARADVELEASRF